MSQLLSADSALSGDLSDTEFRLRESVGRAAYNKLFRHNQGLIYKEVNALLGANWKTASIMDKADFLQEGAQGLLRAIRLFDIGRGFNFSTYAVWHIRAYVLRAVRDKSRLVRLPQALQNDMMQAPAEPLSPSPPLPPPLPRSRLGPQLGTDLARAARVAAPADPQGSLPVRRRQPGRLPRPVSAGEPAAVERGEGGRRARRRLERARLPRRGELVRGRRRRGHQVALVAHQPHAHRARPRGHRGEPDAAAAPLDGVEGAVRPRPRAGADDEARAAPPADSHRRRKRARRGEALPVCFCLRVDEARSPLDAG